MTKRILAIVLALVLSLSVLSVEAFASVNGAVTATVNGNVLSLSWEGLTSAAKYVVSVTTTSGATAGSATVTTNSATVTVNSYGTLNISVIAYNSANVVVGSFTGSTYVAQSSTSGTVTVSSAASGQSVISWTAVAGVASYYVSWTSSNSAESGNDTVTTTSKTVDVDYANLTSVTVRIGNASGNVVGSWTKSNTGAVGGGTSSTGNVSISGTSILWPSTVGATYTIYVYSSAVASNSTLIGYDTVKATAVTTAWSFASYTSRYNTLYFVVYNGNTPLGTATYTVSTASTGGVYASNGYIYWTSNGSASYTISMYANAAMTTLLKSDPFTPTSITSGVTLNAYVSDWVKTYAGSYNPVYIRVTSGNTVIGSTPYNVTTGGGDSWTSGNIYGLTAYRSGNYLYLSWNSISGASYYVITGTNGSRYVSDSTYLTSYSLAYTSGTAANLTVTAYSSANVAVATVGVVSVTTSGVVSTGNSGWSSGNVGTGWGTGTGTGNYVYGTNCTLNVGTTSTTVSWGGAANAVIYILYYTDNNTGLSQQIQVTGTSTTIPIGSSTSSNFTVGVIAITTGNTNGEIIASATYKGSTTSTTTKSEYENLTLTESGASTIVSWDKVADAKYYLVYLTRVGGIAAEEYISTTNSYTLAGVRSTLGFEIYVSAVLTSGRQKVVGHLVHVAGDPYPTASSGNSSNNNSSNNNSASVYVTGFHGTASAKSVSLAWNAASGASSYEIQWKRSSDSTWKKAGTTSKLAATINGLNTGVSYDFKIIANGRESGVLTISTTSSGSNSKTAPDPAGAGTTSSSNLPVITSASGSNGSFTVSWSGVTGGNSYQVWVATGNSSTYSRKATVTGTSATISGLSAGTYKVRIKASTDGGKTYTALKDCDYFTVTVK